MAWWDAKNHSLEPRVWTFTSNPLIPVTTSLSAWNPDAARSSPKKGTCSCICGLTPARSRTCVATALKGLQRSVTAKIMSGDTPMISKYYSNKSLDPMPVKVAQSDITVSTNW